MAFYDGLGQRLQKTGQGALDKTKKTAEILRINTEISGLEKEREEAYAAIGKLYFESHPEGAGEGMTAYFDKVAECTAKIVEDEEKVAALKGCVRCKKCGKMISAEAPFCQYCGASTAGEEEPVQAETEDGPETVGETVQAEESAQPEPETNDPARKCPICGAELEEGVAFCANCGFQLI